MRNDKEFKAKNRDESYVKNKHPDIQLGRHTEAEKQKPPLTPSKKNHTYRARQTENGENVSAEIKVDGVPVPADSAAQFTDRNIEPTETENISQDIQQDVRQDVPKSELPYSSAANKKKYRRKMHRMQKQAKSVEYDFTEQTQKSDNYDISEKVQENKTEFSKNTDMDFSESVSERDSILMFGVAVHPLPRLTVRDLCAGCSKIPAYILSAEQRRRVFSTNVAPSDRVKQSPAILSFSQGHITAAARYRTSVFMLVTV